MSRTRDIEVDCTLEIEQTAESLHAHAIPEGVEIRPGDRVLLLATPPRVGFGERVNLAARARVRRAGPQNRVQPRCPTKPPSTPSRTPCCARVSTPPISPRWTVST
jgi:hypothetical protein